MCRIFEFLIDEVFDFLDFFVFYSSCIYFVVFRFFFIDGLVDLVYVCRINGCDFFMKNCKGKRKIYIEKIRIC